MTNRPSVRVELADYFLKDLKRLRKKYPSVRADVQMLVRSLENGETPGDRVQGIHSIVYKVRIRNSALQRGKSGGYRVIYYLRSADFIILLTIYSKSEQENITSQDIQAILENIPPPQF